MVHVWKALRHDGEYLPAGQPFAGEGYRFLSDLHALALGQLRAEQGSSEGVVVVLSAPKGGLAPHQPRDFWKEAVSLVSGESLVCLAHLLVCNVTDRLLQHFLQGLLEARPEALSIGFRGRRPHTNEGSGT